MTINGKRDVELAVRSTVGSAALEGMIVTPDEQDVLRRLASGEIDVRTADSLMDAL